MSQFEKQFQEFEAQVKKVSDFWTNLMLTSAKEFFNTVKIK